MKAAIAKPVAGDSAILAASPDGTRRALFLDRDGIVNVNHGYVHTAAATEWVPGVFDLARAAHRAGYLLVVATNQAGIARGYYTRAQFEDYTRWVHARFVAEGAPLAATYYCPHHPVAGIGEFGVDCDCRKPRPGLLLRAAADLGIDLGASLLLGDSPSDVEAADAAGVRLAILCRDPARVAGLAQLFGGARD
ncbi:MAG: HAD family hydrolase [Xanthomonadales bacterium]|nr:HAD family hydrolase [Xanthomonadaceae bacterium]MBN8223941.1 HAD family hydrolase [Xanthomonadales bacterium]HRF82807.1 HAD family hydrolase [Pseudoxanthomonas sp.]